MKKFSILLPITFLLLAFSTTSFAQTMLGPKGVGGFVGYVKPEGIDGTFGFGAFVDMGTLTPMLGLDLEVLYWSKSWDENGMDFSTKDFAISSHVKYRFPVPRSPVKPYAGGGIGIHIIKWEHEHLVAGSVREQSDTEAKFGFQLLGGGEYEVSSQIDVFAQVRFSLVENYNQFGLFGGAKFKLGI